MGYQDVDIAFQNALFPFFMIIRLAFFVFLFKLMWKFNKYLDRQLKHDCTTCEYKQKCIKEQFSNSQSNNGNL